MRLVRRGAAARGVRAAMAAACGPTGASGGHARHDSWIQVHDPAFTSGTTYGIAGLAAPVDGYPRWTAVGNLRPAGTGSQAAVWTSSDGAHWGRMELDAGGATEATAAAAATGAGRAVVVGTAIAALGDRDSRIWTSTDGATWKGVDLPHVPGDQSLTTVAGGPLGFVAAGTDNRDGRTVPAVWVSGGGSAWQRAQGPFDGEGAVPAGGAGAPGGGAGGRL